jgi:hypothetical protein
VRLGQHGHALSLWIQKEPTIQEDMNLTEKHQVFQNNVFSHDWQKQAVLLVDVLEYVCADAGNDFSTLYAPLIRDGRMEKYYWNPTRADRIGVCQGIFKDDQLTTQEIEQLVDSFPGQTIDFFGALRARIYDDLVRGFTNQVRLAFHICICAWCMIPEQNLAQECLYA